LAKVLHVPLRYCHGVSTTILRYHEQLAQRKVCPCFIKDKVRRKMRKRVLEVQKVQTPSLTLEEGGERKEKTNLPK